MFVINQSSVKFKTVFGLWCRWCPWSTGAKTKEDYEAESENSYESTPIEDVIVFDKGHANVGWNQMLGSVVWDDVVEPVLEIFATLSLSLQYFVVEVDNLPDLLSDLGTGV